MRTETESYAYLRITGSGPVDRISKQIGLPPDKGWSEGDARPRGRGLYEFSSWSLFSGEMKGMTLDAHLRSLWRRIAPHEKQLRALAPEFHGSLVCVAWFPSRDADFTIAAGHWRTIAYYGLTPDFDFYFEDEFGDEQAGKGYWSW